MSGRDDPVQIGLVEPGMLREDFRRFLRLVSELAPGMTLREEPFAIVAELDGEPVLRCRPSARLIRVVLGPGGGAEVGCRGHEDFVDILASLLAAARRRCDAPDPAA